MSQSAVASANAPKNGDQSQRNVAEILQRPLGVTPVGGGLSVNGITKTSLRSPMAVVYWR
jgi:hypothetical protein